MVYLYPTYPTIISIIDSELFFSIWLNRDNYDLLSALNHIINVHPIDSIIYCDTTLNLYKIVI